MPRKEVSKNISKAFLLSNSVKAKLKKEENKLNAVRKKNLGTCLLWFLINSIPLFIYSLFLYFEYQSGIDGKSLETFTDEWNKKMLLDGVSESSNYFNNLPESTKKKYFWLKNFPYNDDIFLFLLTGLAPLLYISTTLITGTVSFFKSKKIELDYKTILNVLHEFYNESTFPETPLSYCCIITQEIVTNPYCIERLEPNGSWKKISGIYELSMLKKHLSINQTIPTTNEFFNPEAFRYTFDLETANKIDHFMSIAIKIAEKQTVNMFSPT